MRETIRTMDESPVVSQRLLTLPEAAHYLGCTLWSVRELIWKGRLPYARFGKRFRVDRKDLDDLVDPEKEVRGWAGAVDRLYATRDACSGVALNRGAVANLK
jgi:excisionase family DNA binding protein